MINLNQEIKQNTSYRTSYPWMWFFYRMAVIIGGTIICIVSLYFGFKLVQQGAIGEFTIKGEKGDFKGFITSISPGLFFVFCGSLVAIISYLIQPKRWGSIARENTKRINKSS